MKEINIKTVVSSEEEREIFVFLKTQNDYQYQIDPITSDVYVSVFDWDMIVKEANDRLAKKSKATALLEEYLDDFFIND